MCFLDLIRFFFIFFLFILIHVVLIFIIFDQLCEFGKIFSSFLVICDQ